MKLFAQILSFNKEKSPLVEVPTGRVRKLWPDLRASSLARVLLSAGLTLAIVALLLTQISIADVASLFANLSYQWLILGACLYLVHNMGRAVRLRLFLPNQETHFHKLLPIVNVYTMFNYILPAWAGEFSLLYFLRKYEAVSLDRGSAALVVGRIIDYLAVAVIFIIGAWFSLGQLLDTDALFTTSVIKAALVMILLAVILLVSLVWWGQRILTLIEWLVGRSGLSRLAAVQLGLRTLRQIIAAFAAVQSFRRYSLAFFWSLGLWATIFLRFYAFLRALGIETRLLNTIVGSTFAVLSKSIPFFTFGGIGTHEAGWTLGFMLVGFNKTLALSSGFAVNMLTLLTTMVLGVCSFWLLHFLNTSRRAP